MAQAQSASEELPDGLVVCGGHGLMAPPRQKKLGGHVWQIVSEVGEHWVVMNVPGVHCMQEAQVLGSTAAALRFKNETRIKTSFLIFPCPLGGLKYSE